MNIRDTANAIYDIAIQNGATVSMREDFAMGENVATFTKNGRTEEIRFDRIHSVSEVGEKVTEALDRLKPKKPRPGSAMRSSPLHRFTRQIKPASSSRSKRWREHEP